MKIIIKKGLKQIKRNLKNPYWKLYGSTIRNPSLPGDLKSFLFVCKGNICRSPFAEHLAAKIAEERNLRDRTFYSVGLDVSQSLPSPREAVRAAESFGVGINGHKSKQVTQDRLKTSDMIIAMEAAHFKHLRKTYPQFQDKIFLLPLFEKNRTTGGSYARYNIVDPYGKPLEQFLDCYRRIEDCLDGLFSEIK